MKIGMIAMSGIRACDPELLALGLTLPGFVERSKTIASLPSLVSAAAFSAICPSSDAKPPEPTSRSLAFAASVSACS